MVARWMQQKIDKQKRMRRAYLHKSPSQGVNRDVVAEYYGRVKPESFLQDVPRTHTISPLARDMHGVVVKDLDGKPIRIKTPKSKAVEALHEHWQSERLSAFNKWTHVQVRKTFKGEVLTMYFSGERYLFVERTPGLIKASCVYKGREQAIAALTFNNILWRVCKEI